MIEAKEAKEMGIVLSVVPAAEVLEKTLHVARQIATASPVAGTESYTKWLISIIFISPFLTLFLLNHLSICVVRALTKTLRTRNDQGLDQALLNEANGQAASYAAPDILEGLSAIKEKRDPRF